MIAVDLIRKRILLGLQSVKSYISCLPDREEVALQRMHGQEGAERAARIADYILRELGHEVSLPEDARFSQSRRAAQQIRTDDLPVEAEPKKRGRPAKLKTQASAA